MLDKIIPPCPVTAVTGEADGTTSGGALSATLTNGLVVPGTVSLSDGTNTFTDDGKGVLTGSPAGTGTINYRTGAFTLASAATAHAVVGAYSYFSPAVQTPILMENSIAPMFAQFRNEAAAGAILVLRSQDGTNFEQLFTSKLAAWTQPDIGITQGQFISVYTTSKGRFIARAVNPT